MRTVVLLRGTATAAQRLAQDVIPFLREHGGRTGVLMPDEELSLYADLHADLMALGPSDDLRAVARSLFARLRELDSLGVDVILAREVEATGLGLAIRDRLFRAAEGRVLDADSTVDLDAFFTPILQARANGKR